jgi:hypothetical protein
LQREESALQPKMSCALEEVPSIQTPNLGKAVRLRVTGSDREPELSHHTLSIHDPSGPRAPLRTSQLSNDPFDLGANLSSSLFQRWIVDCHQGSHRIDGSHFGLAKAVAVVTALAFTVLTR